jgi:pimeloyl-ACP methyl ester carboxylesterase
MKGSVEHHFVKVDGIRMHYVSKGKGRLLLLLHGFPDFWYVWRVQIPTLAKHYHVVAPDLRGYNETDKPAGVDSYRLNLLAGDVLGLIHALGEERAFVAGHDWGGAIAWSLASFNPEAVEKLVVLNAPHPNAYTMKTSGSFRQLQKSWYVFFFQMREIPEEVLSHNDYFFLKSMLTRSFSKKGVLKEGELQEYVKAWSKPGALTAALNYYRANMSPHTLFLRKTPAFPKVKSPTLGLWGEQDAALSAELFADSREFVDAQYGVRRFPEAGHWVQLEEPNLVNRHIRDFLNE